MPITPTDISWIAENFKWLFEQFGQEAFLQNELVTTSQAYFPYKLKIDDNYPLEALKKMVCTSMQIDSTKVNLEVVMNEDPYTAPYAVGYYDEILDFHGGEITYQITLNLMPRSDKDSILYALAHSLTYIKLLGENRISAAENDYNYLTDLCLLFWGFGIIGANQAFLIQKGYFEENPGMVYTTVSRSGYLPVEMWAYALSRYCQLTEIDVDSLFPFLSSEMQQQIKESEQLIDKDDNGWKRDKLTVKEIPTNPLGQNLLPAAVQQKFNILNQAILNQSFAQAWLDRARLYRSYGLIYPALKDLHHLIETDQLRDQAHLEKAQIALGMGLWQETLRELVELTPEARAWPETLYVESSYYWITGKEEEAESLLKQTLIHMPRHAQANWSMGTLLFWRKEWDAALAHFNAAIQEDPLQPLFWTHRAKIHLLKHDLQAASHDIHTALGLNKTLAEPYIGRGVLRRKEKRYDAALKDFETALRLDYNNTYATWHQSVIKYMVTEELWIPVGVFETLEDAFPYRQQLNERGIKHRFRDPEHTNLTASTDYNKWLYVREDRMEEAMDILTEGWW